MSSFPKLTVLAAYPYMTANIQKKLAGLGDNIEFLLDSGAYTAWKQKKLIALDEYCSFLDGLPFRPWRYFALDVIGDHAATRANYEAMRRRGYAPMPIYTRGAPLSDLHRYAEDAEVVGMGGLAGTSQRPEAYVKAMLPHMQGKHLHLLGFTQLEWLKYVRPYSVDSSSWMGAARYGTVQVYMGRGRIVALRPGGTKAAAPSPAVCERIRRYGFDPYALRLRDARRGNYSIAQQITTLSWLEFSMDCRRRLGTRLFLAFANEPFLDQLLDLYAQLVELRRTEPAGHVE